MGYTQVPTTTIKVLNLDDATTVSGEDEKEVNIRPPSGFVYIIRGLTLVCSAVPEGPGFTTHGFCLYPKDYGYELFRVESPDDETVAIYNNTFSGTTTEAPSTGPEQFNLLTDGRLKSSYNDYLILDYFNNSGTNQTNTRVIRIYVEKVLEGSF
jgi:hypothetical protein